MKPAVFGLLDSTATRPDPPARNWEKELVQEMRVVKMCWAITGSCCNSSSLTVRMQIKWFLDLYICNTYIISFYDTLAGSILFLNLYDQTLRISGERHCCNILQLLFPCVVFLPSFGREAQWFLSASLLVSSTLCCVITLSFFSRLHGLVFEGWLAPANVSPS